MKRTAEGGQTGWPISEAIPIFLQRDVEPLIITTVMKNFIAAEAAAAEMASTLNARFEARNRRSIASMLQCGEPVLVVGVDRVELYSSLDEKPFFFHPNSAMFRIKRLIEGGRDPYLEAAGICEGKKVLDCTLGLGSDSIVASYAAGKTGRVTGVEGNREMAVIVGHGLKKWDAGLEEISSAMRRVDVIHANHLDYLQSCGDDSFDIVYFDPMFEEEVASEGMGPLKQIALYHDLNESVLEQAKRVAKERVVLKDHWKSGRFEKWGFTQLKRRAASFHFGVLEIED
ncbi:class I SAM-dependent methyltransferase [Bacillus sp. FJAT-42376]|uniref:class I SAM-dependent methyltransferase n=1 Tax=Bacillus sp. FJAT-42376 TaxID=2014076 RepID=UPI001F14F52C|nr:class I SAM-dependent methyltransferase [Bacillus sp. FJAT-42376]